MALLRRADTRVGPYRFVLKCVSPIFVSDQLSVISRQSLPSLKQHDFEAIALHFIVKLDMHPFGCIIIGVDETNDSAVFRALADPTRRLIIDDLNQKDGQSLFEVCGRLSQIHDVHMARQSITKHLKILEDAGIIRVEWKGRTKMHFLEVEPIQRVGHSWIKKYL